MKPLRALEPLRTLSAGVALRTLSALQPLQTLKPALTAQTLRTGGTLRPAHQVRHTVLIIINREIELIIRVIAHHRLDPILEAIPIGVLIKAEPITSRTNRPTLTLRTGLTLRTSRTKQTLRPLRTLGADHRACVERSVVGERDLELTGGVYDCARHAYTLRTLSAGGALKPNGALRTCGTSRTNLTLRPPYRISVIQR